MKHVLLFFFAVLAPSFLFAQADSPQKLVQQAKEKYAVQPIDLLNKTSRNTADIPDEITEYQVFDLDRSAVATLFSTGSNFIQLSLPKSSRETLELELVEVDLPAFTVRSAPSMEAQTVKNGRHYRGIVKGDQRSVVSLSVFEDGIMALVSESRSKGNWVLGKLEKDEAYIFYHDEGILKNSSLDCATEDVLQPYTREELSPASGERALTDCVRMYFEVDYDIYQSKGSSLPATVNYITGLYNQVATLYAAESINTSVSEILVWEQTSPYSGSTSIQMLNQFTAYRTTFNGDLAMLLSYQASGGVAYLNGLCAGNLTYRKSFSSINSTYSTVPTYSWSVMVVTHEFGHLLGSNHTHACVWNGNSTAIDGCYTVEGNCSQPGLPPGGGTIMSYCHLTSAGINFNNGFGPQPGNVIRNKVTNATCLQACSGGGCTDNEAVLTIKLDNYPSETTWNIKNSGGTVLYSGGPYSSAGNTITIDLCEPDGCYDFTINDSYGDGICCSYGQGFYNVTFNGNVLISGGQFGSVEVKQFCLSGGGGPTCTDGIQNGDETGVDCGGSTCPPCATCNDGIQNGDETGVDCGGSTCPPCATCNDGIQNGDETGVDCGGSTCPPCATCNDGIQNGNETGVDCGGSCPACPTCNDGIQNGDETGIDCGGSTCPPCGGGCSGTEVTISILLDNYPGETTWNLKNSNGVTLASGGPYNGQSGATITHTECLPNGCYDFTINDSYGDGICCAYGQGSYTVFSGNTTYASGGNFTYSEVTNFCVSGGNPPTCNDGIQNGDETGVDCGGSTCPPCATCNDGIQNGDETGVDCGGSICAPCPTCTDGIQNGDETGVDCGGSTCPPCSSCNDGIQNGDETGVDCGGSICAPCPTCTDGIQNGDETGVDCGGSICAPCPTCTDGIQNGDETGVDCGGSTCPPCGGGGSTTLAAHYFESGWDSWIDGGSDCFRYNGSYSYEGSYSIRLRDNSGDGSTMFSPSFDFVPYSSVDVEFYFYPNSMETGESFSVDYHDGSSWVNVAIFASGTDFNNGSFYVVNLTLLASNYTFHTASKFKITCNASTNSDQIYVDAVTITGHSGSGLVERQDGLTKLEGWVNTASDELVRLHPNPADDILFLEIFDEEEDNGHVESIDVYDMIGRKVMTHLPNEASEAIRMDVSGLEAGTYILRIQSENEEMHTLKFQIIR